MLIDENRWRAKRYGLDAGLVDFGLGQVVGFAELLEELFELTNEDAQALDCVNEVRHTRDIVQRGTSAHRQLARHMEVANQGGDPRAALEAVVDMLIAETVGES